MAMSPEGQHSTAVLTPTSVLRLSSLASVINFHNMGIFKLTPVLLSPTDFWTLRNMNSLNLLVEIATEAVQVGCVEAHLYSIRHRYLTIK